MGSLATALAALDEALRCDAAAARPSDALRVRILNTRAKIRRRQKDFTAAAEDVTSALELAHGAERRPRPGRDLSRRVARRRAAERVRPRPRLRGALEGALRARLRPRVRRQAPEQPRPAARDHRQAGRGRAAAARVVPDRGRAGQPRRCRVRSLVAGLGAPAHRRSRRCHRERKSRDRAIGIARGIPRRRRECSNGHGARAHGAGSHRRGRAVLHRRRGLLHGGGDGQPPGRRMGCARRCGRAERRLGRPQSCTGGPQRLCRTFAGRRTRSETWYRRGR